jgi:hypothetical protein
MTKPKAKSKGVDPVLVRAIKEMMAEVMEKPKAGENPKYSLTERCKVLDRFLKVESIRLNVQQDDSAGEFFKNKEADDEPNE